jgi:hypothetical protein
MDEPEPKQSDEPAAYEPPRIVWREAFQPVEFAVSCAKEPANPGCVPGPART